MHDSLPGPRLPAEASAATWIIYPRGLNWFYEEAARQIHTDLAAHGVAARRCSALEALSLPPPDPGSVVLVVSLRESVVSLGPEHAEAELARWLEHAGRCVLVNYDCIYTDWFHAHFTLAPGLVTDVMDVNVVPQTRAGTLAGVPYFWIPESMTSEERASIAPWTPGRPVHWAVAAHNSARRAVLVAEALRHLGTRGFAFVPRHRPYGQTTGTLDGPTLDRLLARTDIYVWNTHHPYPYHECLRAPQAIRNGAVPFKVDPEFAYRFSDVPWVFPDFESFLGAVDEAGLGSLHERCRDYLLARAPFGAHLAEALRQIQAHVSRVA
jgi:hypothetical protein